MDFFNKMNIIGKAMLGLILLALISALIVGFQRNSVESSNKNVEIVMDYNAFSDMTKIAGFNDVFSQAFAVALKEQGLSSMSFSEDTIDRMAQDGRLSWYYGADLPQKLRPSVKEKFGKVSPEKIYLTIFSNDTALQLSEILLMFQIPVNFETYNSQKIYSDQNPYIAEISVPQAYLLSMPCGFNRGKINLYKSLGFNIVLRPESRTNINPDTLSDYYLYLPLVSEDATIIFSGQNNDVIGFPNYISDTAAALLKSKMNFGIIEAPNVRATQKGIKEVASKCAEQAIRVMSISQAHQDKLSIEDMSDKYLLGVRERNIRMIYIRPHYILENNMDLSNINITYLRTITSKIESKGFQIAKAEPFKKYSPNIIFLILLSLGAFAFFVLLLERMESSDPLLIVAIILWVIFTAAALLMGKDLMWRQISALVVAIFAPVIAFVLSFETIKDLMRNMEYGEALKKGSFLLCKIFGISLAGGLIVCAILSSNDFFVQAQQFRGIKLLLILPVIITLLLWIGDEQGIFPAIKEALSKGVNFAHLLVLAILGAAGGYHILRSGNSSEGLVSGTELSVRDIFAKLGLIRPRFKEFLLGFPALMLFPALFKLNIDKCAWILIACGSIASCDLIDTFAHIHTPIGISLARVFLGLILGWIVGAFMLGMVFLYDKKKK